MNKRPRPSGKANQPFKKPRPAMTRTQSVRLNALVTRQEEQKDITLSQAATLLTVGATTSVLHLINPCAQGVTTSTRAGRRIMMKSLLYNWPIAISATTTGASPIRLVIVLDKQANGAAPTAANVFLTDSIDSPMNLDNSRRFKVLVDECNDGVSATGGPESIYIKGYRDFSAKPGGGIPVEFHNTSNGDITDITSNSVYSFAWSNGGFGTLAPTNTLTTRIRFTDA